MKSFFKVKCLHIQQINWIAAIREGFPYLVKRIVLFLYLPTLLISKIMPYPSTPVHIRHTHPYLPPIRISPNPHPYSLSHPYHPPHSTSPILNSQWADQSTSQYAVWRQGVGGPSNISKNPPLVQNHQLPLKTFPHNFRTQKITKSLNTNCYYVKGLKKCGAHPINLLKDTIYCARLLKN